MSSRSTADHAAELLSSIGPISIKRMFGGFGLYAEGVIIALIVYDRLFLKTDEQSRPAFNAAACEPFVYEGKGGKQISVNYFEPPAEAFDSAQAMQPWARLAVEASLRAANAKAAKQSGAKKPVARKSAAKGAAATAKPAVKRKIAHK